MVDPEALEERLQVLEKTCFELEARTLHQARAIEILLSLLAEHWSRRHRVVGRAHVKACYRTALSTELNEILSAIADDSPAAAAAMRKALRKVID